MYQHKKSPYYEKTGGRCEYHMNTCVIEVTYNVSIQIFITMYVNFSDSNFSVCAKRSMGCDIYIPEAYLYIQRSSLNSSTSYESPFIMYCTMTGHPYLWNPEIRLKTTLLRIHTLFLRTTVRLSSIYCVLLHLTNDFHHDCRCPQKEKIQIFREPSPRCWDRKSSDGTFL